MQRRRYVQALGAGGITSLTGCLGRSVERDHATPGVLTLATATTAADSGLLDVLLPPFERTFGTSVRVLVRGTGASLRTASDGDCDLVVVHAREQEDEFLRAGGGVNRRDLMCNDFLLVGPSDDPAGVAGLDILEAFRGVARSEHRFLSRGDDSGTHARERALWASAGVAPSGTWYRETGQGMGATLVAADRNRAYTLTDRGTFLTVRSRLSLGAHVDTGLDDPSPRLRNEYGVIVTNPLRSDGAYPLALALVGFLTGPGQELIEAFRADGEPAFRAAARSTTPNFGQYVPSDW